ncbi:hypothetical protein AYI68_g6317, partial [Smittium mucronatum]
MEEPRPSKSTKPLWSKAGKGKAFKKVHHGSSKPSGDMSLYSEVSVKHMLHEGDQRCLKKFFIRGSDRKLGCSWSQFRGKHGDGIEYFSRSISNINHMRKDDHRAKVTYFIFDFDSDANDFMSKKLVFADRKDDLCQTVRMEQDIVVINIPKCGDDGMFAMV